jgi:hypothetical protein
MKRFLPALLAASAQAALTDMHIIERSDVEGGQGYERIVAKAYFAVDPRLPANRLINDLRHAPVNAKGLVEFSADIHVLKPRDPARGNGTLLFEVSNRGGMGLGMFHGDDGLLLKSGYTIAWVGWQFDLPEKPGLLRLMAPAARGVSGPVRAVEVVTKAVATISAADRSHVPYAPADPNSPDYRMLVRNYGDGERRTIPRNKWRFVDGGTVTLDGGFEAGKIYEVAYTSKDPAIAGLGPAAIRDFVSFLKYGGGGPTTVLGDQRRFLKRALGFGSSQSGRFLRTYLYNGFNADERGRIVFDGLMPHIAGGARGSFVHRFAQPSRGGPYLHSDLFPFLDPDDTDPVTDTTDGILRIAAGTNTVPKIFYTNTANEYWRSSASLIHTTIDGKRDAGLAPTTRIYFLTGCQHGSGNWPPAKNPDMLYPVNTLDYGPIMRALLVAMNDWITSGKEPPASRYPLNASEQLVAPREMRFPRIPGFKTPAHVWQARRLDYGPNYRFAGLLAFDPPKIVGDPFPVKLPQVDADGNETGGIRNPILAVPLGTHLGWNLAAVAPHPDTEMANLTGSYIAFARTRAEREHSGDARLSIEERYRNREDYLSRLTEAAEKLVAERYLLAGDVMKIQKRGLAEWDTLAK